LAPSTFASTGSRSRTGAGLVVDDVVDAGSVMFERQNGGRGGVVEVGERGDAAPSPTIGNCRLRTGSRSAYRLVNTLATIFMVVVVYSLNLPYTPAGLPWNDGFDVSLVNYTPLAIVLPLIFGAWYLVSAKDRYQGPVRTLEEDEITAGA
jgi:hypothetical protein